MEGANRKPTGKVERWWITANLMFDTLENGVILYGDFIDTPGLADKDRGGFNYKAGVWRVDFLERIVEFEDCYVYLGTPQSLASALENFVRPETGQTAKEKK
jgi:hypothetical protein